MAGEQAPKNRKGHVKRNPLVQSYLDDLFLPAGEAGKPKAVEEAVNTPKAPPSGTTETAGSVSREQQSSTKEVTEAPSQSPVERVSAVTEHMAEAAPVEVPVATEVDVVQAGNTLITQTPEVRAFPEWSEYDFDSLIFEAFGIRLAAPMERLGGIHALEEYEKISLFGQPDWYLGVVSIHGQKMKLIDSAKLLMPERGYKMTLEEAKFGVQLNKTDWCLACHSLKDSIMIPNAQVQWRKKREQRPWFIGTLIEYMCSLIDVERLVEYLDSLTPHPLPKEPANSDETDKGA